jgi:hypothetical protein
VQVLEETFRAQWGAMSEAECAATRSCVLTLYAQTCTDTASPADMGFVSRLNDIIVAVRDARPL